MLLLFGLETPVTNLVSEDSKDAPTSLFSLSTSAHCLETSHQISVTLPHPRNGSCAWPRSSWSLDLTLQLLRSCSSCKGPHLPWWLHGGLERAPQPAPHSYTLLSWLSTFTISTQVLCDHVTSATMAMFWNITGNFGAIYNLIFFCKYIKNI